MNKKVFIGITKQEAISTCENLINSKEDLYHCFQIVEGFRNGDFSENSEPDIETYLYWITRLAENKSLHAMNRLGQIYSNGEIVAKDIDKAKYWYTMALPSNDYVVKQNLAHTLLVKSENPADNKQGFDLCVESINDEGEDGAYILGIAYDEGLGINQNLNTAFYLYQIAVAQSEWCRKEAEKILTMYKSDYITPITYLDFYPDRKYEGSMFRPNDMKKAVFDGIDFTLSFYNWYLIESVFKYYWENHYDNLIDFCELRNEITSRLQVCNAKLSQAQLDKVIDIMIDFIQCTGGCVTEDREYINWYNEADMLDHGYFSPLTALISYDNNQRAFISAVSHSIKEEKKISMVWSRSHDAKAFACEISKYIFSDHNYEKYFALDKTNLKGVLKLNCVKDTTEIADLYIIEDESLNVFDLCDKVHLCKRDFNIEAFFVDDMDFLTIPSELMSLKNNIVLQWSITVFKALARSIEVPVLVQKIVSNKHEFSKENTPTIENAVPHRECIEEMPDRIVVVYYEDVDGVSAPYYTVVKDNKYSTGRVIFINKEGNDNE